MKIIKGVLEDELKKAMQAQGEYEKALAALPCGVLVKKFVKGYPAPWHPPAPAGGGKRFLATMKNEASRVSREVALLRGASGSCRRLPSVLLPHDAGRGEGAVCV